MWYLRRPRQLQEVPMEETRRRSRTTSCLLHPRSPQAQAEIRAEIAMVPALLLDPTWSLLRLQLGRLAEVEIHPAGPHPRWAHRMLFPLHLRYQEPVVGRVALQEARARTAVLCWRITLSRHHHRLVEVRERRDRG